MDSSLNPKTFVKYLYQQANYHLVHQQVDQALSICLVALNLDPDYAPISKMLGVIWQEQEDFEQAEFWYQKALKLQPNYAEVYGNLGDIYSQKEDWETAILNYRKGIECNPNLAVIYQKLAKVLIEIDQQDEGEELWYKALHLEPGLGTFADYLTLGNRLFQKRKINPAIFCYQKAIQANPNGYEPYHNLGEVYFQLQHWENAAQAYSQAIKRNAQGLSSFMGLGNTNKQLRKWENAIHCYQRVIELNPTAYLPHFQIAEIKFKLQQWDQAIANYQNALKVEDQNPFIYLSLSRAYSYQKQWEEAIAASQKAILLSPDLPHAHTHLGNFLSEIGEVETAIQAHQKSHYLRGWNSSLEKGYRFTKDWFTVNILQWEKALSTFANCPEIQGLEIGSFQGMSACWLLDHILTHATAKITCIDLGFKPEFDLNIAKTGVAEKVTKLEGYSQEILSTLTPNTYNFVYIDGCHLASVVLQDALLSWNLLKPGGIMIFDDYEYRDPDHPEEDTGKGIDQFIKTISEPIKILHQGYQLMIQK
jgi:tetratricopeptide (TPR) repeat protein